MKPRIPLRRAGFGLSRLRISARLAFSFGLLCLLMLLISVSGHWLNTRTQESVATALDTARARAASVEALRRELLMAGTALRDAGLSGEAADVTRRLEDYMQHRKLYESARNALIAQSLTPAARAKLDSYLVLEKKSKPMLDRAVSLAKGLAGEAVKVVLVDLYSPMQSEMITRLDELAKLDVESSNAAIGAAFASASRASIAGMGLSALACAMGGLLAWRVTASVTAPLRRAQEIAGRIAKGDLTGGIDVSGTDETALALQALDTMRLRLVDIVEEVQRSAASISRASHEIAQGNVDLSSRTELQAAQLQQTVATTQNLASAVSSNASRAKDADGLAKRSSESSTHGREVIQQVISTMQGIEKASNSIAEINQVIDGIAFQTNILALNAAVEAARAGEQGRGFAVVAAEVRVLSQRSASAAKEIRELIDRSKRTVSAGVQHVNAAGLAVGEITSRVGNVSQLITEIADVSDNQSNNVALVNASIGQLDRFTQQNAALVEQMAASAGSLHQQTVALSGLVARFKVPDSHTKSEGVAVQLS